MQIITSPHRLNSLPLPTKIHRNLQRIVVDELKDQYDDDLSAIWNELDTFLVVLDQHERIESCPPLASQLTYCATYPEIVESLSDGWVYCFWVSTTVKAAVRISFFRRIPVIRHCKRWLLNINTHGVMSLNEQSVRIQLQQAGVLEES